jgi:hypothetical protein
VIGVGGLGAAVSSGGREGLTVLAVEPVGAVCGVVVDPQGLSEANLGQLILMHATGRHAGRRAVPDASGRFAIDRLPRGDYQIRFHAPGEAMALRPCGPRISFSVHAGRTTELTIPVVRGDFGSNQVEIHCIDDAFQRQPDGEENGETIVRLGTVVSWHNVGTRVHSVSGGPWHDSGVLHPMDSYIWVANQVGLFPYHCRYSRSHTQAVLRVTA